MSGRTIDDVRVAFAGVVDALKRTGLWDIERPPAHAFEDMGAFGMKTMAFEQWLRWVFVPRVEEALREDGPWPATSMVATQAYREFDGVPEASEVVEALRVFDDCFPLRSR